MEDLRTAQPAAEPIISVRNAGIVFHRGRRHRSLRDLLFRGEGGLRVKEFWGLKDINFDIYPGESVGVVGRNGQGKSTLLKLIAGVLLPDTGSIQVNAGVAPLIEITGGFVGDLTVRENIQLMAGLHGMDRRTIAERFDEMIDFAEVEDFVDTPFKHLSSGMRARVAFSVVSNLEEPIVLVDEVLAVGDRAFKRKCFKRFGELIGDGRTLFMVSHSERNLRRFCTRGLYINEGRLVGDGPMDEILARYSQDAEISPRRPSHARAGTGLPRRGRLSAARRTAQ
jgi:ABC-2 type transport system ATP-binding protein